MATFLILLMLLYSVLLKKISAQLYPCDCLLCQNICSLYFSLWIGVVFWHLSLFTFCSSLVCNGMATGLFVVHVRSSLSISVPSPMGCLCAKSLANSSATSLHFYQPLVKLYVYKLHFWGNIQLWLGWSWHASSFWWWYILSLSLIFCSFCHCGHQICIQPLSHVSIVLHLHTVLLQFIL